MKTFMASASDIQARWFLLDASGKTLGRLATFIAGRLRGKHKPEYTPHVDCGDHIVVVNALHIQLSGNKPSQKVYYHHSGYPGGLRETPYAAMREKHPERILEKAVKGMLPKGPLGRAVFRKLKVYAGPEHRHQAQCPEILNPETLGPETLSPETLGPET